MVFAMIQLQEKSIEQNMPSYSVFIDLAKAFDSVYREALWVVLERIGCPPKFISIIRLFHDGMTGHVLPSGNVPEAFAISNGLKQGCVLAPVLFNVFFTCMLTHAVRDLEKGVRPRCSTNLHQTPTPPAPTIVIDDTTFTNVEHFKYLGSTISCDGSLDKELGTRIGKASQALGRLRNRVLNQHNITLSTKLKVYNAVVFPSLLYGCETWTLYRRNVKKLEHFHMRALRSILGIRWQGRVTNLEVLDRANSTSIESVLLKAQLRWVGHVIRMEEFRMPRRLMYGELQLGKRNQGRPKLRYKDTVKANLQCCHIKPGELEERAMDRPVWRASIHKAASNFEEARSQKLTATRERRHEEASAVITTTDFQCPHCSRLCASRLGLQSHLRVHR